MANDVSSAFDFYLGKGVNLSHWLCQRYFGTPEPYVLFNEQDVQFLKENGFQHVRISIDEALMWNSDGTPNEAAFELLNEGLEWLNSAGMRVVLDLHFLNCHNNRDGGSGTYTLYDEPDNQRHLEDLWKQLSSRLKHWSNDFLAYELLGEPVAPSLEQWNSIVENCLKIVRKEEPYRNIVIGSNQWEHVSAIPFLKFPENDKHIILSFHFYDPVCLTMFKAPWFSLYSSFEGPVNYPGYIVSPDVLEKMPEGMVKSILTMSSYNTKETMREEMLVAVEFAKSHNVPLYCGEWGCIENVEREMRLSWYRDVSQILEEEGIPNAIWEYKGPFGIRSFSGNLDESLMKAVVQGK